MLEPRSFDLAGACTSHVSFSSGNGNGGVLVACLALQRNIHKTTTTMSMGSQWGGCFCLACIREKEVGVVEDLGE